MPLVLMCGLPASGKSTRAAELQRFLAEEHQVASHVVDEGLLPSFDRNGTFQDAAREKEIRGLLRSEVQKRLNRKDVIILDSGNYIKGYRYELYCLSKANKTTACVLECIVPTQEAWALNLKRPEDKRYSHEVFEGLNARYEAPDSRNRWDSPLFGLQTGDALPGQVIYEALYKHRAPPAHQATQSQPLLPTNFLYELDRITQDVVRAVLEAQKVCATGDEVVIQGAQTKLRLSHVYTGPELARLRRQFITYTKMHPVEDGRKLGNLFVHYLNGGLSL